MPSRRLSQHGDEPVDARLHVNPAWGMASLIPLDTPLAAGRRAAGPPGRGLIKQDVRVVGFRLTFVMPRSIILFVSTSLGEASAWIQATDPERRKTPRVRTAFPGLRVEPKWLLHPGYGVVDTPCSAEALTRGVPARPCRLRLSPVCREVTSLCVVAVRRWGSR